MATAIPVVPANYESFTTLFPTGAVQVDTAGMTFINNGISAFYVSNQSMATPTTVTVTSVPDAAGRGNSSCDNLTKVVAAGDTVQFGPFTPIWWNQPNGQILVGFSATDAAILVTGIQFA